MLVLVHISEHNEILRAKMNEKECSLREDAIDWMPKSEITMNDASLKEKQFKEEVHKIDEVEN